MASDTMKYWMMDWNKAVLISSDLLGFKILWSKKYLDDKSFIDNLNKFRLWRLEIEI